MTTPTKGVTDRDQIGVSPAGHLQAHSQQQNHQEGHHDATRA